MDEIGSRKPAGDCGSLPFEAALRRYFHRRVPPQEIDDLVQEVHNNMHARRGDAEIEDMERYVFVVAANILRKRSRGQGRLTLPLCEGWEFRTDITPERIVLARDWLRYALEVIEHLPARSREIFILHRFEDMTYSMIARKLGISVSAVEKHIIVALRALKSALDVDR